MVMTRPARKLKVVLLSSELKLFAWKKMLPKMSAVSGLNTKSELPVWIVVRSGCCDAG